MASPFPGMNPYLEHDDVWHNFHEKLCSFFQDRLIPQVRPAYIVKCDEHIYVHENFDDDRRLVGRADVSVAAAIPSDTISAGSLVADAPAYCRIPPAVDIERESYLEIRDHRTRELITVIEVLSPANKRPGPDREQYLAKRRQIVASPVHFVEIDLLRGGKRMPLDDVEECDYLILVSRAEQRPRAGVWPLSLRDRLPHIPIPLRIPDADAQLDLQQILHDVYDVMACGDYIYDSLPIPPLAAADADWARQLAPV